jgi:bifunctional DNase/RNase
VEALGGRVLRASLDEFTRQGGFHAHLALATGSRELLLDAGAGEALSLAVQAGAPIVVDPMVLDEAGVAPGDLHGRAAREIRSDRTPAPVLHF